MSNVQVEDEILSRAETAAKAGFSTSTLDRKRRNNCGPRPLMIGKYVTYRRRDVDAWLEEQAKRTGARQC
jgi:predicted DNA-binding transcriptional regulator AlpA